MQGETRERATQVIVRQLVASQQLEALLPIFKERHVPVVLLKGAAFWDTLYRFGERSVADIDMLVPARRKYGVRALMVELGYERVIRLGRPVTDREYYNDVYLPPLPGLPIEVHTCLGYPARHNFDIQGLFARAQPHPSSAAWLSPEDNLLHLALHRAMHGFDGDRRNFEDAARLIANYPIDWPALVARARLWGCVAPLWLLLNAAGQASAKVVRELAPGATRRRYSHWLLTPEFQFRWPGLPGWPRRLLVAPLLADRTAQQLRFAWYYARLRLRDLWTSFRERQKPDEH